MYFLYKLYEYRSFLCRGGSLSRLQENITILLLYMLGFFALIILMKYRLFVHEFRHFGNTEDTEATILIKKSFSASFHLPILK